MAIYNPSNPAICSSQVRMMGILEKQIVPTGLFVMSLFHKEAPMDFNAFMGGVYQTVTIM